MISDFSDKHLIFIISQPRAGSTMLQRILGNHSQIHTVAEPWILLHPLYALRHRGHWAEYNTGLAHNASKIFIDSLPEGENDYFLGLRRMFLYMYERAISQTNKTFFLDKTPRYYLIIQELLKLFPNAHFIFLLRNPLSVLSSVLRTWRKKISLFLLSEDKYDLISAPKLILKGIGIAKNNCIVVSYERIVNNPDETISMICEYLGVDYEPSMINLNTHHQTIWKHGDKTGINLYSQPVEFNTNRWIKSIDNPQTWRLSKDYLHLLGADTINKMGYSYQELSEILENHKPNIIRSFFTLPLGLLVNLLNIAERGDSFERGITWFIRSISKQGLTNTIVDFRQKIQSNALNQE